MKERKFLSWVSTILFGVFGIVFVWTLSLSTPIYLRYIYYSQIGNISKESGYSEETIKTAYNDVMDYLCFHKEFKTGELSCSVEAKEHFADCQRLFDINLISLGVSIVGLVVISILASKKVIKFKKIGKFNVWFYGAIVAFVVPLIFAIMAVVNFDWAFTLFHKILFPGKTNWMFNSDIDQIINILPESYFTSCGGIAFGVVISFVVGTIMWEISALRKQKKQKNNK